MDSNREQKEFFRQFKNIKIQDSMDSSAKFKGNLAHYIGGNNSTNDNRMLNVIDTQRTEDSESPQKQEQSRKESKRRIKVVQRDLESPYTDEEEEYVIDKEEYREFRDTIDDLKEKSKIYILEQKVSDH